MFVNGGEIKIFDFSCFIIYILGFRVYSNDLHRDLGKNTKVDFLHV